MSHRFLAPRLLAPGLLALVGLGLAFGPASAADLDPGYAQIPPVEQEKVEFGTGWYIRGDLGATGIPKVVPTTPTLGYAPAINFQSNKNLGYTGSIGGGYSFNSWFRMDAVFDFHQPINSSFNGSPFACQNGYGLNPSTTSTTTTNGVTTTNTTPASSYATYGSCTGHYQASLKSYDALVNGYADLGTWYGLTPYVGAGVGLSFGHYQTSSTFTQADNSSYNINVTEPVSGSSYHIFLDRSASGQYYNLAFALMAGISYDIYDHTKLDIGYRYLHLGQILGSNVTTQEVRAGLRYMIDN